MGGKSITKSLNGLFYQDLSPDDRFGEEYEMAFNSESNTMCYFFAANLNVSVLPSHHTFNLL